MRLTALLALLLVGCTTAPQTIWSRPGLTMDEFRRDRYACIQESRTSWSGGGSGLIGLGLMASAQSRAQDQAERLYALCMEARGYSGRPAQPGEEIRR